MLPKLPTIEEAARRMRQKELTPLDLVDHCLGRIAQFEDRIHAWVLVDEEGARKEAKRLGDMLGRGEDLGPLHGMPIGIKDIIDVAGWQTKCGSKLRENVPPAEKDATVVANLRNAGAIILGKTVTTEFACFDPPPTRNPWNLDHTPGGSSSGSAAAVAMEMCMAAIGTQTGGSIIRPAAYCGVCGFKPSFERLGMDGIMPLTMHLDHVGPMARRVTDLRLMDRALLGFGLGLDKRIPFLRELPSFSFCAEYFQHESSAAVWQAFNTVIKRLADAGAIITMIDLPKGFGEVHTMHRRIMAVEAADVHQPTFQDHRDQYSPHVRTLIDEGRSTSLMDYVAALRHRRAFRRTGLSIYDPGGNHVDAFLLPSTPTVAPDVHSTGDPKFNSIWSYMGPPTVTIPVGSDSIGLPLGLQIVGMEDRITMQAARFCEQAIGWKESPPILMENV